MVSFNSPYYPYEKVATGVLTFRGAERIPKLLADYLLDLPDGYGYTPVDDNNRPRVRLMKYLWHDGANPLSKPLPTPGEKLSLLFDGANPVLNTDEEKAKHPKGYRLFPQAFWLPAEFEAFTQIKFYVGRNLPYDDYVAEIGLTFDLVVNYMQDGVMRTDALSRLWAMECDLVEALNGVNITGIGKINYNRRNHMDDGSHPFHDDGTNVCRCVGFSLTWAESNGGPNIGSGGACYD